MSGPTASKKNVRKALINYRYLVAKPCNDIVKEIFGYPCVMKILEETINLIPVQEALETLFHPLVLACACERANIRLVGVFKVNGC
jgi:hypothetical protein